VRHTPPNWNSIFPQSLPNTNDASDFPPINEVVHFFLEPYEQIERLNTWTSNMISAITLELSSQHFRIQVHALRNLLRYRKGKLSNIKTGLEIKDFYFENHEMLNAIVSLIPSLQFVTYKIEFEKAKTDKTAASKAFMKCIEFQKKLKEHKLDSYVKIMCIIYYPMSKKNSIHDIAFHTEAYDIVLRGFRRFWNTLSSLNNFLHQLGLKLIMEGAFDGIFGTELRQRCRFLCEKCVKSSECCAGECKPQLKSNRSFYESFSTCDTRDYDVSHCDYLFNTIDLSPDEKKIIFEGMGRQNSRLLSNSTTNQDALLEKGSSNAKSNITLNGSASHRLTNVTLGIADYEFEARMLPKNVTIGLVAKNNQSQNRNKSDANINSTSTLFPPFVIPSDNSFKSATTVVFSLLLIVTLVLLIIAVYLFWVISGISLSFEL